MSVINVQHKYNDNKQKHILFLTKFNNEVFTLFIYVIYVCLVICLFISCILSLIYFLHDIFSSPIDLMIGQSFIPNTPSTKHLRNMVSQIFYAHIYNIDILLALIFQIWFQTIIYILWTHICYTHSEFKQIHFNWVISQWCTRFISGYLVMISHLLT